MADESHLSLLKKSIKKWNEGNSTAPEIVVVSTGPTIIRMGAPKPTIIRPGRKLIVVTFPMSWEDSKFWLMAPSALLAFDDGLPGPSRF